MNSDLLVLEERLQKFAGVLDGRESAAFILGYAGAKGKRMAKQVHRALRRLTVFRHHY